MVNKKGWLRIVEASIAILIIFSVLLIVNNNKVYTQEEDLTRIAVPILEEIARNASMREYIVSFGNETIPDLKVFVGSRIKQSTIKYDVNVCKINEICGMSEYPSNAANVYASERMISTTLYDFNPQKVKLFLWRETR